MVVWEGAVNVGVVPSFVDVMFLFRSASHSTAVLGILLSATPYVSAYQYGKFPSHSVLVATSYVVRS